MARTNRYSTLRWVRLVTHQSDPNGPLLFPLKVFSVAVDDTRVSEDECTREAFVSVTH